LKRLVSNEVAVDAVDEVVVSVLADSEDKPIDDFNFENNPLAAEVAAAVAAVLAKDDTDEMSRLATFASELRTDVELLLFTRLLEPEMSPVRKLVLAAA